jgi:hypothetical protein
MINSLLAKGFTFFAQILVKLQPIWDKYKALIGLVIGVLIGWFVLGWGIFPVEWVDATPGHLREDFKSAYLAYVSEEYFRTGDMARLRNRLGLDLPSRNVPWLEDRGSLEKDLETAIEKADRYNLENYRQSLVGLQQVVTQQSELLYEGEPTEEPTETPAETTPFSQLLRIIGIVIVILLVGAAIFAIWSILAGRRQQPQKAAEPTQGGADTQTAGEYGVESTTEAPVKSFNTPYVLGDDYFDPSFSIEIGNDFLGECGIGISETIGAGDPKKVTAFEAWLFDKSDIRTVTTVLASQYAYEDDKLRSKLQPKGEIVMLKPDQEIVLETTSLRVKAKVKDLEYAQSNDLPAQSFIQKVNFELQAWVKQVEEPTYPDYEDYELD